MPFTGDASNNTFFFTGPSIVEGETFDGLGGTDTFVDSLQVSHIYDLEQGTISDFVSTGNLLNFEIILAGQDNDILIGGIAETPYTLDGWFGDDTIKSGSFGILTGDRYLGGEGIDFLDTATSIAAASGQTIDLVAEIWQQFSRTATISGFEQVDGHTGDDLIRARSDAATTLSGGLGEDTIALVGDGLTTGSAYNGGGGRDVFDLSEQTDGYSVNVSLGTMFSINVGGDAALVDFEEVRGGIGDDFLTGGLANADGYSLFGGGGDDTIVAGDTGIIGGDQYHGGQGTDVLDTRNGVGGIDQIIDLAAGIWTQNGITATVSGFEEVIGNTGNDIIGANDSVRTTIAAGLGDDTITLGSDGLVDGSILDGEDGTDVLDLSNQSDGFRLELGTLSLTQISLSSQAIVRNLEMAIGGSGNDILESSRTQAVTLDGGDGDDRIEGTSDTGILQNGSAFHGGLGTDSLIADLGGADVIDLDAGTWTQGSSTAEISGFEAALSSGGDDFIRGASDVATTLIAGNGADTIATGSGGLVDGSIFDGGFETDVLDFSNLSAGTNHIVDLQAGTIEVAGGGASALASNFEVINAGAGDDLLGARNDVASTLTGGLGDDTIMLGVDGAVSTSRFEGGTGTDVLDLSDQSAGYTVSLETGSLSENGTGNTAFVSGFEVVNGSTGNDGLSALANGASTLDGGDGDDSIAGSVSDLGLQDGSAFHGGEGRDILLVGNDTVNQDVIDLDAGIWTAGDRAAVISGFEQVTGGNGNDFIRAQSGVGTAVAAGLGDDTVATASAGLTGAEQFAAGDGADVLDFTNQGAGRDYTVNLASDLFGLTNGGPNVAVTGFEAVLAGAGHDMLIRGTAADVDYDLNGGAGNDTLMMGSATAMLGGTFAGGAGTDMLDLSNVMSASIVSIELIFNRMDILGGPDAGTTLLSGIEQVIGTLGDDRIVAAGEGAIAYNLNGGGGDDTIVSRDGGLGDGDIYDGGAGSNFFVFGSSAEGYRLNMETGLFQSADGAVVATVQNFEIVGGAQGNDVIAGTDGQDQIQGGGGNDRLLGRNGADNLFGQDGNDNMGGGTGADTLDGGAGNDRLFGEAGNDALLGGVGNDTLVGGDGNDGLQGGEGNDAIAGNTGNDTLEGMDGNDRLWGEAGADTLNGGAGADRLDGGAENDVLAGGAGIDTVIGGNGNDTATGGADNDAIAGNNGNDQLSGEDGNDRLWGQQGFDTLNGGAGADRLDGGGQADNLFGGAGNDTMIGGAGFDRLFGGDDNDIGFAGNENDALYGQRGDDRLNGQAGNDRIFGGIGNDFLDGSTGADSLFGGAGFDTLLGGTGNDMLQGNFNADQFIFADAGGGFGRDTISDFDANNDLERIDLSRVASVTNLNDLLSNHVQQVGQNVVIDAGGGNTITLQGVDLNDLGQADFIF